MKFNKRKTVKESHINYDGGKSFKLSAQMDLVLSVLNTFLEDKYYEGKDARIERIKALIRQNRPEFVAKLALVARNDFHLRSVSHLLVGELSLIHRGDSLISRLIPEVAERVDDLIEILSYVQKPIPNQVKKGVAKALQGFNRYQLSKYKMEANTVKLVDLFNLVHPIPTSKEQKKDWKDLMTGELKNTETWEARLSSGEDKEKVWEDLVLNDKIGYMALLRNLRNILKQGNAKTIKAAGKMIADEERVMNSKQLPFRFLSAYTALKNHDEDGIKFEKDSDSTAFVKALEKAITVSVKNLPLLKGKTVILSDNSGSMTGDSGGLSFLSSKSVRKTSDIGNLFSVLYWTRCDNTFIGLFGDRLITPKLDREAGVFENFNTVNREKDQCGSGTETGIFKMFEQLIKEKKIVDRIVVFSDTQIGKGCNWYDDGNSGSNLRGDDFNALVQEYRKIAPKVKIYNVDLQGYGDTVIANGAYNLGGWSERIFDFMEWIEKENELVSFINDKKL